MHDFFNQIEASLQHNLYYVALFTTLAIPDVCGAIEASDGQATPTRYKAWFDKHLGRRYVGVLTGEDCWAFRCSLLHQGSSQHPNSSYSRVLFIEPNSRIVGHCNVINDALNLDVGIFCRDMIEAGRSWLKVVESSALYAQNYSRFMHRYPNGLPPYISGIPVIS